MADVEARALRLLELSQKLGTGPLSSKFKPLPIREDVLDETDPGVFPNLHQGLSITGVAQLEPGLREKLNLTVTDPRERLATLAQQTGRNVTDAPNIGPVLVNPETGEGEMLDRPWNIVPREDEKVSPDYRSPTLDTMEATGNTLGTALNHLMSPKMRSAIEELSTEARENVDILPDFLAKTPATGLAVGTGVGALRQYGKNKWFPETTNFSPRELAVESTGGAIGGYLNKIGPGGSKEIYRHAKAAATASEGVLGEASEKVLSKGAPSFLNAEELAAYNSGTLHEMVGGATNKAAALTLAKQRFGSNAELLTKRILNSPNAIANEIGVPAKFKLYNLGGKEHTNILDDIKWLQENSPKEFAPVVNNFKSKTKFEGALKEWDTLGSDIKTFNDVHSTLPISGKKIFGSDSWKAFTDRLDSASLPGTNAEISKVKQEFFGGIAKNILNPKELEAYAKGTLHLTKKYKNRLFKTNEEALFELAQEKPLTLNQAFGLRKELDSMVSWSKDGNISSALPDTHKAYKDVSNSIRNAITDTIEEAFGASDMGEEYLRKVQTFHHMTPIVQILNQSQANAGSIFDVRKWAPGVINTPWRMVLLSTQLASKNPVLVAGARKILGADIPVDGVKNTLGNKIAGAGGALLSGAKKTYGAVNTLRPLVMQDAGKQMVDSILGDSLGVNNPELKIPRDPELISHDPTAQAKIMQNIPNELKPVFLDAIKQKDMLKKEAFISQVIETMPDLFEPSVSGMMSEVKRGGKFIIANEMERKMYQQSLTAMYRSGRIGSKFLAVQLSALNDRNDLSILPLPPDPNQNAITAKPAALNEGPQKTPGILEEKLASLKQFID